MRPFGTSLVCRDKGGKRPDARCGRRRALEEAIGGPPFRVGGAVRIVWNARQRCAGALALRATPTHVIGVLAPSGAHDVHVGRRREPSHPRPRHASPLRGTDRLRAMLEQLTEGQKPLVNSFVKVLGNHRAAVENLVSVLIDIRSIVAKMEATNDPNLRDARQALRWARGVWSGSILRMKRWPTLS